jgi:hypothetical protein
MSISPVGDEILEKEIDCSKQGYKLETVFINPTDLAALLTDLRFQGASYNKNGSPLERGEIGRFLGGVKVIVSNNVPLHKLLYSVNMSGYRSLQGPAWETAKTDDKVNPSRRDS